MGTRYASGTLGKPEEAPGGAVRLPARLTRPGVFAYRQPDGSTVRDYRPAEVLHDALPSLQSAPLTIRHPRGDGRRVSADNWRELSVGHVETPVVLDDGWIGAPVVVCDAGTLRDIDAGKIYEVSLGFSVEVDPTPGVTPEGEPYDRKVVSMKYNHLALLPAGEPARVPGAVLCLDSADDEIINDAGEPAPPQDTSTRPGEALLTEAQVATMIAEALAPVQEALTAAQRTGAELADKLAQVEARVEVRSNVEDEPPAEPPQPPQEGNPPAEPPTEPPGKSPVEDSLGVAERIAQAEARASVAEARLAALEGQIDARAAERLLVLDSAREAGLPVAGSTFDLKRQIIRRTIPTFDSTDPIVVDSYWEAVRAVSPTQVAAAAFSAPVEPQTPPAPEKPAYQIHREAMLARGPR